MTVGTYRKKPVTVEAIQYDGTNVDEIVEFTKSDVSAQGTRYPVALEISSGLSIRTNEGKMKAKVGDWIIKGVKGEYYPCRSDIFEATYEEVKE